MSANVQALLARQAAKIVAEGLPIGPRLNPCSCGAGQHEHSGLLSVGKCERTGCKRYRADAVWTLVYRALDADAMSLGDSLREADEQNRAKHYRLNPRKPGEWSIGASDTATCPRKIEYRNRPPEDFVPSPEDNREARIGTIIHNEVTRQMKALYPWRLYDYKVRILGLDRDSALDMYDPVTATVTDFKTAGDWRWDTLADDGPAWVVWEQVLLYALALIDAGYEVRTVRLCYIKRCNGHDEVFDMAYDAAAAEAARDRLLGYAQALDVGQSLPKTGTGPRTDGLCRRCFARDHCWNVPEAERLGRSPENLTILGQHPDDAEVAWAIETKVKASAERLAAKKREDEAAALVDGIEPGRYGPDGMWEAWEVPRKGSVLYKESFESTRAMLDLPDGQRPSSDLIEPLRGPGGVTSKVGKVRKATLDAERKARAALPTSDD